MHCVYLCDFGFIDILLRVPVLIRFPETELPELGKIFIGLATIVIPDCCHILSKCDGFRDLATSGTFLYPISKPTVFPGIFSKIRHFLFNFRDFWWTRNSQNLFSLFFLNTIKVLFRIHVTCILFKVTFVYRVFQN